MTRIDCYAPGQFSWVDLMTPDTTASKEFYTQLFGWGVVEFPDDNYTQFVCLDATVAGMGAMPEEIKQAGMPPIWNSYVTVESADVTVARASELGGGVQMPPTDIPQAGRMAILTDPTGARVSIWQPYDHIGAGLVNEPFAFCWNELQTRDTETARRFYGDLFGWKYRPAGDANPSYTEILNADRSNGGILEMDDGFGPMPPSWGVYFAVSDCDETLTQVQSLGGKVVVEPVAIPPGRFAVVSDPLGAVFTVMKLNAPE